MKKQFFFLTCYVIFSYSFSLDLIEKPNFNVFSSENQEDFQTETVEEQLLLDEIPIEYDSNKLWSFIKYCINLPIQLAHDHYEREYKLDLTD